MTATATPDLEQLVSRPEDVTLFMCRREDLRLVKFPRYPQFGAGGQKVGEMPGEVVAFKQGVCRVPHSGEFELEDGRKIDAVEVLGFLERHKMLGNVEEGFWRVDPAAPAPSKEEMKALMRAAARLDVDALERALEEERAGWNRPDMVETIEENLAEIREVQLEAAKLAEEERVKAEAAAAEAAKQGA